MLLRNFFRVSGLIAVLALTGCSGGGIGEVISDAASAVNPVNWFGKDEKSKETADSGEAGDARIAKPERRSTYPKVSEVPEAPKVSTPEQRLIIQEGLLADRANARYADGPPPRLYPQAASPIAKSPRTPVEEASLTPPAAGTDKGAQAAAQGAGPVRIVTVRFPVDSVEVPADTARYLREVVAVQRRFGGTLRVVGHTGRRQIDPDPAKDRVAKLSLSEGRAKAVAAALMRLGLDRRQLAIEAKGDSEPVAAGDPAREAENSRVEVFLDNRGK